MAVTPNLVTYSGDPTLKPAESFHVEGVFNSGLSLAIRASLTQTALVYVSWSGGGNIEYQVTETAVSGDIILTHTFAEGTTGTWGASVSAGSSSAAVPVHFGFSEEEALCVTGALPTTVVSSLQGVKVGPGAFREVSTLYTVFLSGVTEIGSNAFRGSINTADNIALDNVVTIGAGAFQDSPVLTAITLKNVTDIGDNAFSGCTELKSAVYYGTETQWQSVRVGTGNDELLNVLSFEEPPEPSPDPQPDSKLDPDPETVPPDRTDAKWKRLFAAPGTLREYKFVINGTTYVKADDNTEGEISHSVTHSLFDRFSIGGAVSAQLNLVLLLEDGHTVPRGAKIERWVRLHNPDGVTYTDEESGESVTEYVSDWLRKGIFWPNRRLNDDGIWTIEAYDAIRKADVPWVPDQSDTFPMSAATAVQRFAALMGVEIDSRTVTAMSGATFYVDYPTSDPDSQNGDNYTIRRVLCAIAAAYGGNFVMSDEGKILLLPVLHWQKSYVNTHELKLNLVNDSDGQKLSPVSRVTFGIDSENVYTAGDDTGLELSASVVGLYAGDENYPGAEDAVTAVLNYLQGYEYRMFTAEAAGLDPAAEIGDAVTMGGEDSGITSTPIASFIASISDDGSGYPDISAPGEAENPEEMPTASPLSAMVNRQIAKTRSYIEKTSKEIRMGVEELDHEYGEKYSRLEITVGGINAIVTDNTTGNAALSSRIDTTANSITTTVKQEIYGKGDGDQSDYESGSVYSKITQNAGSIQNEIRDRQKGDEDLDTAITQTATEIRSEVSRQISDGDSASVDTARSLIQQLADSITFSVTHATESGQSYAALTLTVNGSDHGRGQILMDGNVNVSGQLSAEALYALAGIVADLTVNRLTTDKRIIKYLAGDTTDDNFIRIHDEQIEFVAGIYAGGTEQATDPFGVPIYWESSPDTSDPDVIIGTDGYPYRAGVRIYTTTTQTPWPVTVYTYTEQVKSEFHFEQETSGDGQQTAYTPTLSLGAGNQQGTNQGYIRKGLDGLDITFLTNSQDFPQAFVRMDLAGWVHIATLALESLAATFTRSAAEQDPAKQEEYAGYIAAIKNALGVPELKRTAGLDFSSWKNGSFTETDEDDNTHSYTVTFDTDGRPVKITSEDSFETVITW